MLPLDMNYLLGIIVEYSGMVLHTLVYREILEKSAEDDSSAIVLSPNDVADIRPLG